METSTILLGLLIIMLILQTGAIYLLLIRKRFKITNESTIDDIGSFLSQLDEEVSMGSKLTDQHLKKFVTELKGHEQKRQDMLLQVNQKIEEVTKQLQDETSESKKEIRKIIEHLNIILKENLKDISSNIQLMQNEVKETTALALAKEEKIRRYEDGYDQKNIKRFNKGYFRILESIRQERQKNDSEILEELQEDLLLLLDDNGIERVEINEGDSYEGLSKFAKVIETVETDDSAKDYIIKEIRKDGYFIQVDDDMKRVIQSAEVIVYKLNKIEGESNG